MPSRPNIQGLFGSLFLALLCVLCLAAPALAEGTPASEVARTGVSINRSAYTPTIFHSGTSPCWQQVYQRFSSGAGPYAQLASRWTNVPLPCFAQPSAGTDGEMVVIDDTGLAPYSYYEFWQTRHDSLHPYAWTASWGGADNLAAFPRIYGSLQWPIPGGVHFGTQASGIAFKDNVVTVAELRNGYIPHPVGLLVPGACSYYVGAATRVDTGITTDSPTCIPYGSVWKLPATVDCTVLAKRVARILCKAARNYGFVASDQTHSVIGFRLENWKRLWAPWSPGGSMVDPYEDARQPQLNLFECSSYPAQWSQCSPTPVAMFKNFPWASLVRIV